MSKRPVVLVVMDGVGTVSYTHLDVYKRQLHGRIHKRFLSLMILFM